MNIYAIPLDEKGSIMSLALLMLLLLTSIVFYGSLSTNTDLQIVVNEKRDKMAFYAADAGVDSGRAVLSDLKDEDLVNWDKLLAGNPVIGGPYNNAASLDGAVDEVNPLGRTVDNSAYALIVRDNNDHDGNYEVDTDKIVMLQADGSAATARSSILAEVIYTGKGGAYSVQKGGNSETTQDFTGN